MNKRSLDNLKSFKPGESGNPGGQAAAKRKLGKAFLEALAADFEKNGEKAIQVLRSEKPEKYCELIASVLPKEANVSIEQKGTVTHEHIDVSEASRRIEELLRDGAKKPGKAPLPN